MLPAALSRFEVSRLRLPSDFADLAFSLALTATSSTGAHQPTDVQGSGTQSYVLFHLLALLDSIERGAGSGWRQSSLWAIEEPESFLHASLRRRLADDLRRFADDPRRQILITTHEDDFVRVADHAWLARLDDGETALDYLPSREAIRVLNRRGIGTYQHPLITLTDGPVVLAEGRTDLVYFQRALTDAALRPRWRLRALHEFDPDLAGGDAVMAYLSANRSALAARPERAPLFLLRDWEEHHGARLTQAVSAHEYSAVLICPEHLANPELGPSFRGIERYLETAFIEANVPATDLVPDSAAHRYPLGLRQTLSRDRISTIKKTLADQFEASGVAGGTYLTRLVRWIDGEVERNYASIPLELLLDS